jgi:hypothetical protein
MAEVVQMVQQERRVQREVAPEMVYWAELEPQDQQE